MLLTCIQHVISESMTLLIAKWIFCYKPPEQKNSSQLSQPARTESCLFKSSLHLHVFTHSLKCVFTGSVQLCVCYASITSPPSLQVFSWQSASLLVLVLHSGWSSRMHFVLPSSSASRNDMSMALSSSLASGPPSWASWPRDPSCLTVKFSGESLLRSSTCSNFLLVHLVCPGLQYRVSLLHLGSTPTCNMRGQRSGWVWWMGDVWALSGQHTHTHTHF